MDFSPVSYSYSPAGHMPWMQRHVYSNLLQSMARQSPLISPFVDDDRENHGLLSVVPSQWLEYCYIVATFLFILALAYFRREASAKIGNLHAIVGTILAVAATIASPYIFGSAYWIFCVASLPLGAAALYLALVIPMTAMPQMVGLLNACGGLSAVLTVVGLYFSPYEIAKQEWQGAGYRFQVYQTVFYLISATLGIATVTGSIVACAKLADMISGRPRVVPGRVFHLPLTVLLIIGCAVVPGLFGLNGRVIGTIFLFVAITIAGLFGFLTVLAIGGADMPVAISVLNSASGWTLVFTGLTLSNVLIVVAGSFVGASGLILSVIMCRAMNKSLFQVLAGGFGDQGLVAAPSAGAAGHQAKATVSNADEVADWLCAARSVIIVPGYGMAVSRAQHGIAGIVNDLLAIGVNCRFAVHPVAGRLPGHMNVLLADANVPYDIVFSMDEINNEFPDADVVVVIGANDTVNPAAQTQPSCAIYGMPVLEAWKAKRTVVLKRSLNTGYAGVDNPMFYFPNNSMLLGDAKASVDKLWDAVKARLASRSKEVKDGTSTATAISDDQSVVIQLDRVSSNIGSSRSLVRLASTEALYFVGILNENTEVERRVMLTPPVAKQIIKSLKIGVAVESGAGLGAGYSDASYTAVGCRVVLDRNALLDLANVWFAVECPPAEFFTRSGAGGQAAAHSESGARKAMVVGFSSPAGNMATIHAATESGITLISLDVLPRITTAQKMDVLSSTGKVAGFRAVVEAVHHFGRLMGAEITAAGKYPPARVLVIGAGVAGLQAIGDAHRLGADVRGFDVRLECKDQVESMGGRFLEMKFEGESGSGEGGYAKPMSEEFIAKEMELFKEQAKECDIIITTAAIPGRRAPILLKKYHIDLMRPGSVVVDLAAATGGNCELTRPSETYVYTPASLMEDAASISAPDQPSGAAGLVTKLGITIVGDTNLASKAAAQASDMYAFNALEFLRHVDPRSGPSLDINLDDEITRAITLCHQGKLLWPPPRKPAPPPPAATAAPLQKPSRLTSPKSGPAKKRSLWSVKFLGIPLYDLAVWAVLAGFAVLLALTSPDGFSPFVLAFVLASSVGYLLVTGVSSALHTPLMSVTNAMSGVVILGGMIGLSWMPYHTFVELCDNMVEQHPLCAPRGTASVILNAFSVAAASINCFGGFCVTHRMLAMFRKR